MMMSDETEKETMEELFHEIEQVRQDAAWYLSRQKRNLDTRFCHWTGKSPDGKKRKEFLDVEPFPFEGASDTEVRLVDMIINENVKTKKEAFFRAKHGKPKEGIEAGDTEWAGKVSTVIKWMLFTQMEEELRTEVSLAAQWEETHGCVAMGIHWHEEMNTSMKSISLAALTEMIEMGRAAQQEAAESGQPTDEGQDLMQLEDFLLSLQIGDETRAVQLAMEVAPEISRRVARRAVKDLIRTGHADYESPHLEPGRPRWRAYKIFDDIFFPASTETFRDRKPRFIATREWFTEEDLRATALLEDWDEEWVEKAIHTKGQSAIDHFQGSYFQRLGKASFEQSVDDYRELIEVWTLYRKKSSPEGVPGIYRSVLHPSVPELLAREEELLDYHHGQYPFVVGRREILERSIIESRGVPELVRSAQNEIKVQRDSRVDYTSMSTMPPIEAPSSLAKFSLKFGPGMINYSRSQGSLRFMEMPREPRASVEVERAIRADVDEYFGRMVEGVAPARALLFTQDMVNDWLLTMRQCLRHTVALMRQFMPEEEVVRITGPLPEGRAWKVDRVEIQGQYDLKLTFDVRDLDPEHSLAKMKLINEVVIPADVTGRLDRSALSSWMMYAVDPHLADEVVKDQDSVSQQEVEDEQNEMTKMWAGIEPPMREGGQNYGLRLQVLQNQLQQNPEWAARLQNEPEGMFAKLIQTRAQHFEFMLQQEQNKQIGRVGAQQVMGQ